jgi:hypothetical protein
VAQARSPRTALRLGRELLRLVRIAWEPRAGFPTLRAAWWAVLALRRLRGEISERGLEAQITAPPELASGGLRGVEAALRRRHATCLERSLIIQRWLIAHGASHEVLIGVNGGADQIEAHAWIDRYDPAAQGEGFRVLTRVAARV